MDRTAGQRSGVGVLVVLFCTVAMAIVAVMPLENIANTEHADSKHVTAPMIRSKHQRGLCHQTEAYISPQRGTLLILCKMDRKPRDVATWGGILWRVLELRHGELTLLGDNELYECTAYAYDRAYWDRVIVRDGYVKAHDTRWYKPLEWLISP